MRGTSAKRLLLRRDMAATIIFEQEVGVPLNTILKKYSLECSRPTLVKLVDAEALSSSNKKVKDSLQPEWLDPKGPALQAQPDNWSYIGRFPLGYWSCKDTSI